MVTSGKIVQTDGRRIVLDLDADVSRDLLQRQVEKVEVRLLDGREITGIQRRKIFAIIRDISLWSGHDPEYLRQYLTWDFVGRMEINPFSLSNVDMTTARIFIDYLIGFCFDHSVPTKDSLLFQTDDIGKYLYLCLEHRRCAVCNQHADVHHVDAVGIGRDRIRICHVGMKAIALCRQHHEEAHVRGREFFDYYHIFGIPLDKYLCDRLNLNGEKKGLKL
jgi:hypothetical protein